MVFEHCILILILNCEREEFIGLSNLFKITMPKNGTARIQTQVLQYTNHFYNNLIYFSQYSNSRK